MPRENSVCDTLLFFQKGKPEPTSKDIHTQLGVHFEEVVEMLDELTCLDPETAELLATARESLHLFGSHLKQNDHVIRVEADQRVGMLDAICDQMVTAIGSAHVLNMDVEGGFNEVNESNLSKFDEHGNPILDPNGKIMKGPNYRKAELDQFV